MRFVLVMATLVVIFFMVYYGLRGVELGTNDILNETGSLESFCISRDREIITITFAGKTREVDIISLLEKIGVSK